MNTKLLRQKVLDLAIHGKLVPQNPEHETATELLERICIEKKEKITKGELKRDKNDSYIYKSDDGKWFERKIDGTEEEIEIPFEIPESWSWCRIKNIAIDMADGPFGSNLKTEHYTTEKEARLIQLSNIGEEGWREENTKYTTFEHAKTYIARSIVEPGNIVIAKMMPAGRAIICPDHEKMFVLSSDAVRLVPSELLNADYLLKAINSPTFRESVTDNVQGSTRMRTSISKLKECFIPLPPLEEQKLIVEEIERIFALIDTVEQNKTDLETVIKQTKSKILDLAIHGKLVPQDKADEPASKLLEKLRVEKAEKIAKGELKRDKNDSYIYRADDGKWIERKADGVEEEIEVPFEIPESWCWCRLPSICRRSITDGTHNSPPTSDKGDYLYVTAKNIKLAGIDLSNVSYVSKEIHDVIYGRCPVELNDVLLTKDGTIGEVTVNNLDYPFSLLSSVALIKPSHIVEPWYVTFVLKSDYMQSLMKGSSKGVALKRIILEQINQLLIPLPPLKEQKRILSKIRKTFSLLNLI